MFCFCWLRPTGHCWLRPTGSCWRRSTGSCWLRPTGHCWLRPTGHCWLRPTGHCWRRSTGRSADTRRSLSRCLRAGDSSAADAVDLPLSNDSAHPLPLEDLGITHRRDLKTMVAYMDLIIESLTLAATTTLIIIGNDSTLLLGFQNADASSDVTGTGRPYLQISDGKASIPRDYVTMIPGLGYQLHWFVTNLCRRTWEAKNYQNDNVKRLKLPSDVSATVGCVGFVQCKKPRRWLRQNAATVQDPRGAAIIT